MKNLNYAISLSGLNLFFTIIICLGLFTSCEEPLSARDKKLEQQLSAIEIKRKELQAVAGSYVGALGKNKNNRDDNNQKVELSLEVKDVPDPNDPSVDPILIPKLIGSLRFVLGNIENGEYIDCPIISSEYTANNNKLYAIVKHKQFEELTLNMIHSNQSLTGDWDAPSVGESGSITLKR